MVTCEDEGDASVCKTVGRFTVRKVEEAARFDVVLWVNFGLLATWDFTITL